MISEEALHWHWNNEGTDRNWREKLTDKDRKKVESWDEAYDMAMAKVVQRFADREVARKNQSATADGEGVTLCE